MTFVNSRIALLSALLVGGALAAPASADASPEPLQSARLEQAKDLIADEQWPRAIEVLRAAAADPRERHKDEALFWLAHSLHQGRDLAAALEAIARLQQEFPKSRWIHPAGSLRLEIAQKLGLEEVLWTTARRQPRTRVTSEPAATPSPAKPATEVRVPSGSASRGTGQVTRVAPPAEANRSGRAAAAGSTTTTVATTAGSYTFWTPEGWVPDTNLAIQALGTLIKTDTQKALPMLKEIALESDNPQAARRAVFVLAQSGRPEAHSVVVEVARKGSEPVQIAAVRELARFGGPRVSEELLQVYSAASNPVKYHVVAALGERAETSALMRIAQTERDRRLQETALVRLGQAGGREELRTFYRRAEVELKRPIIVGLFNARAEDELIRIAEQERDPDLRREALTRLRLLGTEKARAFLERQAQKDKKERQTPR